MQDTLNSASTSHTADQSQEALATDFSLTFQAFVLRVVGLWSKHVIFAIFFFFSVQLVTWLPDIDHWFVGILHHRSILTHSVLLPAIVWMALPARMSVVAAVLFAAVGIHLSADVLSPSQGYGAIWLPAPLKYNLGDFSKVWLLSNAVMAFGLALKSCPIQHRYSLVGGIFSACIFYGLVNEQSGLAAILSVVFLAFGLIGASRFLNFPESPVQVTSQLVSKRIRTKDLARIERERQKSQRGRLYFVKVFLRLPYLAFLAVRKAVLWSIKKPRMAGGIAALTLFGFLWFYVVGSSNSNSLAGAVSSGAVKTVSDGVWVLHSSGGWILKQGGHYVAGTLSASKP